MIYHLYRYRTILERHGYYVIPTPNGEEWAKYYGPYFEWETKQPGFLGIDMRMIDQHSLVRDYSFDSQENAIAFYKKMTTEQPENVRTFWEYVNKTHPPVIEEWKLTKVEE